MKFQNLVLILAISLASVTCAEGHNPKRPVCACTCPFNNLPACDTFKILKNDVEANTEQLKIWARYRQFVQHFSERWQGEVAAIVETMFKEYIAKGKLHGRPENIVQKLEDEMQNDSILVLKPLEDDSGLAKNVSSLLEKVEMVENRTTEVEKELNTERRVRRDLEKKVNMTHSSLVFIEDQLQNVSTPVDTIVTQVEMKLHSSIEDLNKTIYEDHLKKLYYKVEGVAYKNETKKLDERLETVEVELHDGTNSSIVSKLAEDLKRLEGNFYLLNDSIEDIVVPRIQALNSSIGNVIPRIATLESETMRKDAAEELEDKMTNLLNDTEMFKIALIDVLSTVQDVQNLERKFQTFSEQLTNSLEAMERQIEILKNETNAKSIVEEPDYTTETVTTFVPTVTNSISAKDSTPDMIEFETNDATEVGTNYDIEIETNDVTEVETNDVTEVGTNYDIEIETNDATEVGTNYDIEIETNDPTEVETNDATEVGTNYDIEIETNNPTEVETNDVTVVETSTATMESNISNFVNRSRMDGGYSDSSPCDVPVINDPHVLVDIVRNDEGEQILKFGCKPIGLYVVSHVPVPARCEKGIWRNPVSSCTRLPNVATIESLAGELLKEHPCNTASGEFPDPTNCSRFFKCSHGKLTVFPCPLGLRFNHMLKVCDYPRTTECYTEKSKYVEELQVLIPPIHIEPNNMDKPSSHLGTGVTGQLIVHPRSSFTLHCLYPENIYGDPKWNVTYLYRGVNSRVLTPKKGVNTVSLTVTAAKEEDSGSYKCLTPFGLQNVVEVIVKTVICPAFPKEDDYEDVFYRPTPEGELRILGTTAEVQCEEGHKVTAQCMANGTWSKLSQSKEDCTPKKRNDGRKWNCKPLDISKRADLILERNDEEKIVTFKCAGQLRVIGNSFIRCLDDGSWSHTFLPDCKK